MTAAGSSITSAIAWPGAAIALASAALFGISAPLAKLLIGTGMAPLLLAGLLYFASGVGLGFVYLYRRLARPLAEAPLRMRDLPWLGLIILFGGIAGPVLLMIGLAATPASSAALLLNLEGVATMAIAWLVFRENVDRRLFAGAVAILLGAGLLSYAGPPLGTGAGGWAIPAACLCWGIDNNLTRKLSAADPVQIAAIKGLAAGGVNLGLAAITGAGLPGTPIWVAAAIVGFLGYGVSIVLYVVALRHLGAARTSAYFSSAPFLGAALGFALFPNPVTSLFLVAAVLMAGGIYLHLSERHDHEHVHEPMEHEHRHVHDAHHQHEHGPDDPPGEPHVHAHRHPMMRHAHPHYPDLHHRHKH